MSCLFRSLSKFINLKTYELRQEICNFLEQNPVLLDSEKVNDLIKTQNIQPENYIQNMRQSSTWGGGIEIKAFCDIYNYQVNVHIPGNITIPFYPRLLPVKIINISWSGNHFISN